MNEPLHPEPFENGERRWLRRYGWLFPLLGIPIGLLIAGGLWAGILLNPSFLPDRMMGWITLKGLALGLCIAGVPVLWWLGIRVEKKTGSTLRRWPVAPLLGILGVILVEFAIQTYTGQSILWQSVRSRAGNQYLVREISLLRENAASLQHPAAREVPGLVVMGSSQMVHATDIPRLGQLTGTPVFRRAVAGLFPTELVASQKFSDFNPDNRLVLMLSGFDLGARNDIYPDAIRPLATLDGMRHLTQAAAWPFWLHHWRVFTDLGFAARCDLWRSRDYARFLMKHPFEPAILAPADTSDSATEAQKAAYTQLGSNPHMVALCQDALAGFFQDMSGRCREIIVFEGRVNPAYPSGNLEAMSKQMRDFLLKQEQLGMIRYVPLDEQNLKLPESFWKDMTHVNPKGRKRMTDMFARILTAPSPAK